jgi:hypothetical protein
MIDLAVKLFPAAAAAVCLVGLLAVTMRVQKLASLVKSHHQKEDDPIPSIVAGLKWDVTSLADRVVTLEAEAKEVAAAGVPTVRSGMNLNRRTQALRQYRLGQPSSEIAKTLDMPKAEVDLLLKVHRIVSN